MRHRLLITTALVTLLLLTVSAKLINVQLIEHRRWLARAQSFQQRELVEQEQRGRIYDRNGLLLAADLPAVSVALDNYHMTKPEVLRQILHRQLGLSEDRLEELIYREGYFTWIARQLDWEQAQALRDAVRRAGVRGLIFLDGWKRVYPQGSLASNLIGFVGVDRKGLEGVERSFDAQLRGEEQRVVITAGAQGIEVTRKVLQAARPGCDLYLTLDARIQLIAEQVIRGGVRKYRARSGMALVLDPQSGELLAMAQDKGYDLNDYRHSSALQRKNLAVTSPFEPGSSFKPFVALAALSAGAIGPNEQFSGNDPVVIAAHPFHNAERINYGSVTLSEIITHSINTGMIRVAQRLGAGRLGSFLQRLGFGRPTGIGLPGEAPGLLRPADDWSALGVGAVAIGQSVSVTGLQLASRLAALADGGLLRAPRLIKALKDGAGREVPLPHPSPPPVRIASADNAQALVRMMERVVREGTGKLAQIPGFTIAAKSGTGQVAVPGKGYVKGKYTAIFEGFFPADHPQYLILVVLNEPRVKYYYGGETAAPLFKSIAERIIALAHLAPG